MYTSYWPPGIPRVVSIDIFARAFGSLGYVLCDTAALEVGFEKIAIYADQRDRPTHVARQLANGTWTSKLGLLEDIEHIAPGELNGSWYGSAVVFLKRQTQHRGK
jgi:hypothetical protein